MWRRLRAALSPNRPLPQGQDLDNSSSRFRRQSTADVNNRVSSKAKQTRLARFRKEGRTRFTFTLRCVTRCDVKRKIRNNRDDTRGNDRSRGEKVEKRRNKTRGVKAGPVKNGLSPVVGWR